MEYKTLKICIKEAIISKIKAKPNNIGCGCDLNINKTKFIHRKHCRGELYMGELNNTKVVICNKCDSMGLYENYIWTCPICFKKYRDNLTDNREIVATIIEHIICQKHEINVIYIIISVCEYLYLHIITFICEFR